MRALLIDFSGRRRGASWLSWAFLAGGALVLAPVLDDHLAARERLARNEARLERHKQLVAKEGRKAVKGAPAGAPANDADASLRRVAAELAMPWDAVFEALELAVDGDIALLSVAGEGKGRTLRLEAEAKSLATALAFADRLRNSLRFDDVAVVSQEERPAGAVAVVRFQLVAVWSGA